MSDKYLIKFIGRALKPPGQDEKTFSVICDGVSKENAIDNLHYTYGMECTIKAILSIKKLIP